MKRRSFLQAVTASAASAAAFPFLMKAPDSALFRTLMPYAKWHGLGIIVSKTNPDDIGESVELAGVRYTIICTGIVTTYDGGTFDTITLDRPLETPVSMRSVITRHGKAHLGRIFGFPTEFVSRPLRSQHVMVARRI